MRYRVRGKTQIKLLLLQRNETVDSFSLRSRCALTLVPHGVPLSRGLWPPALRPGPAAGPAARRTPRAAASLPAQRRSAAAILAPPAPAPRAAEGRGGHLVAAPPAQPGPPSPSNRSQPRRGRPAEPFSRWAAGRGSRFLGSLPGPGPLGPPVPAAGRSAPGRRVWALPGWFLGTGSPGGPVLRSPPSLPDGGRSLVKSESKRGIPKVQVQKRSSRPRRQKRKLQLSPEQCSNFYADQYGKGFFPNLTAYMSSGPLVAMILARHCAVSYWKELLGPSNSVTARRTHPHSLRAIYGTDDLRNALHGSLSISSAEREIRFMFPEERCKGNC
ncbi:nucleoside diphosphate kinase homolog 5 isoform X2 [Falco rusticolus]|uniref:nucleoside diphosphate kinase homolog 5 isoform X2 n=1 Tax=Falco rusticolus TaxID=120794 RepID=UPI0018869BD3|nr:nucleoside diphosphate kinase homolog 5 isoform X2 [Falco rusticolus]